MIIGLLFLSGIPPNLIAQSPFGLIQNFSPEDYSGENYFAGPQNWGFVQDGLGIVYVANNNGVLSYDGRQWRLIRGTQSRRQIKFGCSLRGTIYLSDEEEPGYLGADSLGQLTFRSLRSQLPDSLLNQQNIRSIRVIDHKIVFVSQTHLLIWDEPKRSFSAIKATGTIETSATFQGNIYLWISQQGLVRFDGQQLQTITRLTNEPMGLRAMLPYGPENEWLLFSKEEGIFLLANGVLQAFGTLTKSFPDLLIWDAIALDQGQFALATNTNGVLICDPDGNLLEQINHEGGLLTSSVIALDRDREGNLWVGMDVGIGMIPIPVQLRNYGPDQGIQGTVSAIREWQGKLYLGTTAGLYVASLSNASLSRLQFRKLPLNTQEVWQLSEIAGQLMVASSGGVFALQNGQFRQVGPAQYSFSLYQSRRFPDQVFVGLLDGLGMFRLENDQFRWQNRLPGITHEVRALQEDQKGTLWAGHEMISALPLQADMQQAQRIRLLVPAQGLPENLGAVEIVRWQDKIRFGTSIGLLQLSERMDTLLPDPLFAKAMSNEVGIYVLHTDAEQRLWFTTGYKPPQHGYIAANDSGYQWHPQQFSALRSDIWSIYTQSREVVWMGASQELYRTDLSAGSRALEPFLTLMREVKVNGDSVIFRGTYADSLGLPSFLQPTSFQQRFPASIREMDFSFVSPIFASSLQPLYSYRLDGYESKWSEWKSDPHKSYTGLREGHYTFHVKAKDPFGRISEESTYTFWILPPWYRSWWALLLYLTLLVLLFIGAVQLRLRNENRKLEQKERELALEREAIEKLRQLDQLKDEFLANTSHELRTPLQGIIGIAESVRDRLGQQDPQASRRNLDLIISSGQRLATLVNDILDFSRLKTYTIDLQSKALDLHALAQIVVHINQTLISGKDIRLHNDVPTDLPPVLADENRLQQILQNLLGNAIKFTDKGHIWIGVERLTVPAEVEGPDELIVWVKDTGIGIQPEQQDIIFKEFQQGDSSISREFGGTGLGLSITRRLVELHGGRIWVESVEGGGTTFLFTLPLAPKNMTAARPEKKSVPRPAAVMEIGHNTTTQKAAQASQARILVVDDEPINQQVLQNHLMDLPYQITIASNGPEALDLIAHNPPYDLVLLDVMMPRMSGYEVCRRIREKYLPSECPVIMITAKNQVKDLVEGLNTGANDYLPKPFSKDELLARIKTHLNLHRINTQTARFVPREFLKLLGRDTVIDLQLGDAVEKRVTVLFTDIRDYTVLAESLSPQDTFRFVNAYAGRMGPIIKQHNGFVQQYLGDGILSIFQDEAEDCLKAAIGMQVELGNYNQKRRQKRRQELQVGMGLHSGSLIMGIIGDELRVDTASISDTVNTASRMEGLSKYFGAAIILSDASYRQLKQPEAYEFRWLGEVQVKGKNDPVGVYECLDGHAEPMRSLKLQTRPIFDEGVAAYLRKDFDSAIHAFERIYAINPDDLAARAYLQLSTELLDHPPKAGWEGIWMLTGK